MAADLRYKVVEIGTVTDDQLEQVVNEWVGKGWQLDTVHYVSQPSSRRPVMAFIYFTTQNEPETN